MTLPSRLRLSVLRFPAAMSLSALLIFATLISPVASAANLKKIDIPAGLELSTVLALFRNLPLMDSETFPPTSGNVYYSHSDKVEAGDTHSFTNTYQFYRKADSGKFISISIVEKHEMGTTPDGGFFHRVFDVGRTLGSVDALPGDARKSGEVSKLLEYVFDHREPLLKSEAGAIAKQLNYGTKGRHREADYSQPRISILENDAGKIEKVQVHGLSALMNESQAATSKDIRTDHILEFSVDDSGKATVAIRARNLR